MKSEKNNNKERITASFERAESGSVYSSDFNRFGTLLVSRYAKSSIVALKKDRKKCLILKI